LSLGGRCFFLGNSRYLVFDSFLFLGNAFCVSVTLPRDLVAWFAAPYQGVGYFLHPPILVFLESFLGRCTEVCFLRMSQPVCLFSPVPGNLFSCCK
jgi:hypothetical protein